MTDGARWIDFSTPFTGRLRVSEDYVVLEDHWIPKVLELDAGGDGDGQHVYARVEVSDSGSKLVELRFTNSDPDAQGIRQADLRNVQVAAVTEALVAGFTFRVDRDDSGAVTVNPPHPDSKAYEDALRFVGRLRSGRTSRDITPQLLERVAEVYRDNISGHPGKAVEHHFQVGQRMAAEYVSRARKRGLLPPTKKGQKRA
jgi:hypothetical protein